MKRQYDVLAEQQQYENGLNDAWAELYYEPTGTAAERAAYLNGHSVGTSHRGVVPTVGEQS